MTTTINKIKILPPELASQIAAGEVVERPASVLKELIENSLDAGASSIEVEVSLLKKRIRVRDDGHGIPPDELELALSRHGTSKISDTGDIFAIGTYGFRGEALPSIASVSRLTLASCRRGARSGRKITVEGGKEGAVTEAPPLSGTEVTVENLFYNTPARKKFARSNATEMTHITSRVIEAALSSPGTRFTFIREGKRALELPPAGSLKERIAGIFGEEHSDGLLELDHSEGEIRIGGLAGKPDFNRATSIDQHFFVNGRPVKDFLVRSAVLRAYADLMPRERKPVIFLLLEMPLDRVDVNVHPAKAEVRFSDPGGVSSAIVNAIRGGLGRGAAPARSGFFSQERAPFRSSNPATPSFDRAFAPREGFPGGEGLRLWERPEEGEPPTRETLPPNAPIPGLKPVHGRLGGEATAIGQLFKTFILVEEGERLVLMDQHTVHERILFERIMKKYRDGGIERQALLIPATLKAAGAREQMMEAHLPTFDRLGWTIEPFGPGVFTIREVPALLAGKDYVSVADDLLDRISRNRDTEFNETISSLISSMACRGAVMAGDTISLKEINALLEELGKAELPYTCPHGRPVSMEITRERLYREFGRSG